jgi:deoxyhypusine synthase
VKARKANRPVMLGMGAHVIKCGLNPFLIKLLQKGAITSIALNGAGAIHDFELAAFGETSEDVGKELAEGRFGCVEETGSWMCKAFKEGAKKQLGMGQSLFEWMKSNENLFPHREKSLLWTCGTNNIPITSHVAIGTDFIHIHPEADGTSIGATSFKDFEIFAEEVEKLEDGVYWNLGSAVILPEVFLKAVSRAHNLGFTLQGMTTINMDMIIQYRSMTNVVKRPSVGVGAGYHLTGHHEIMLPIVAMAVLEGLEE